MRSACCIDRALWKRRTKKKLCWNCTAVLAVGTAVGSMFQKETDWFPQVGKGLGSFELMCVCHDLATVFLQIWLRSGQRIYGVLGFVQGGEVIFWGTPRFMMMNHHNDVRNPPSEDTQLLSIYPTILGWVLCSANRPSDTYVWRFNYYTQFLFLLFFLGKNITEDVKTDVFWGYNKFVINSAFLKCL